MKQVLRYRLETLSPVHIGSGEEYGALDGVYWEGRWYLIDIEKAVQQSGASPTDLANAMMHSEFNWASWLRRHNLSPQAVARRSVACAQNPERTKIRACLRDPYERPYVPGSTLKGAIRTALLEALINELDENRARRYIQEIAQRNEQGKPKYDRRYVARRVLEKDLLTGDKSPRKKDPRADLDPNYDLLRALHVVDSEPIEPERVEIGLVWVYTIRNRALVQKRASNEEYKMLLEWLPAGVTTQVEIVLDAHLLSEPVRQQLGFTAESVQLIQEFAAHCNERARSLIESETEFYEVYALPSAQRFYKQLQARLQQVEHASGFLLNIGWGSGWEAKAVLNPLTEELDNEYEQVRRLYGLGRPHDDFPKTRRLAYRNNQPYAPLGWIALTPLSRIHRE